MKKFFDFAGEQRGLEGEKTRLDDIVNREIIATGYRIAGSKHNDGKYLTLQFQFINEGWPRIVFTGSTVLASQMEKYGKEMPFQTIIKKIDKYYTMT